MRINVVLCECNVNNKDEKKNERIKSFRNLEVYKRSFDAALEIFKITKNFPAEEKYSLIDQIRRSSRSVCANIAEAWKKRIYPAAFVAKLSDSAAEAAETQVWLEFSLRQDFITEKTFLRLDDIYEHIGAILINMAKNKNQWTIT